MDEKQLKLISKWLIIVVASCLLVYLFFSNIHHIFSAVAWLIGKGKALWIGILFAMMLDIPMTLIENRLNIKGKRQVAILLSLLFTLGLIVLLIVLILPELYDAITILVQIVSDTLDQLTSSKVNADAAWWVDALRNTGIEWMNIKNSLDNWIQLEGGEMMNTAIAMIKGTTDNLISVGIGLVFAVYLLSKKEVYLRQFYHLMQVWLPDSVFERVNHVFQVSYHSFRLFLVGQVTEGFILGILCTTGMLILGIPYAPMIGVLVGVTALIPYLGGFIGMSVGCIVIFASDPFKSLVFLIYLFVLQQVEGNLIYPKVVGSKIKIPPIWVFIAVTLGGSFAGPLGMFFGVPIVSSLVLLLKEATAAKEKKKVTV